MKATLNKKTYHVFTDGKDEYCSTVKEGVNIWRNWVNDGFKNIRIEKLASENDEAQYHSGRGNLPY